MKLSFRSDMTRITRKSYCYRTIKLSFYLFFFLILFLFFDEFMLEHEELVEELVFGGRILYNIKDLFMSNYELKVAMTKDTS